MGCFTISRKINYDYEKDERGSEQKLPVFPTIILNKKRSPLSAKKTVRKGKSRDYNLFAYPKIAIANNI